MRTSHPALSILNSNVLSPYRKRAPFRDVRRTDASTARIVWPILARDECRQGRAVIMTSYRQTKRRWATTGEGRSKGRGGQTKEHDRETAGCTVAMTPAGRHGSKKTRGCRPHLLATLPPVTRGALSRGYFSIINNMPLFSSH